MVALKESHLALGLLCVPPAGWARTGLSIHALGVIIPSNTPPLAHRFARPP